MSEDKYSPTKQYPEDTIRALSATFLTLISPGVDPMEINQGLCADFADYFIGLHNCWLEESDPDIFDDNGSAYLSKDGELLPEAFPLPEGFPLLPEEVPERLRSTSKRELGDDESLIHWGIHVWINYKGKHYDAEAPGGVDHFLELPFWKRRLGL